MGNKKTQSYSEQYRREAVARAAQPGQNARKVADELGIHVNQIYNWRTQFKKLSKGQFKTLDGVDFSQEAAEEIYRLKQEIKQLKLERELLKKAAAYFANQNL